MGASSYSTLDSVGYSSGVDGPANSLSDYPFTMCLWARIDVVSFTQDVLLGISDGGGLGVATNFLYVQSSESAGNLTFRTVIQDSGGTDYGLAYNTGTALGSGQWFHVAFVCAGNTSKYLYIDGDLKQTEATSHTFQGYDTIGTGLDSQAIGEGYLSDMQLYNTALSGDQLKEIMYNPFGLPNNLIWHISMRQGSYGSTASNYRDMTKNSWDCNVIGGSFQSGSSGPSIQLFTQCG